MTAHASRTELLDKLRGIQAITISCRSVAAYHAEQLQIYLPGGKKIARAFADSGGGKTASQIRQVRRLTSLTAEARAGHDPVRGGGARPGT